MDEFFMIVGMAVLGWWLFGVLLIAFKADVYVAKGAPVGAKLAMLFQGSFVLPWMLFVHGSVPAMVLAPEDRDEETEKDIKQFLQSRCQCPACKARRGE